MSAAAAFGIRVRDCRKAQGWTQDDLAAFLGMAGHPLHQTGISKLESGHRPTTVDELVVLARLFGVSPSFMVKGIE